MFSRIFLLCTFTSASKPARAKVTAMLRYLSGCENEFDCPDISISGISILACVPLTENRVRVTVLARTRCASGCTLTPAYAAKQAGEQTKQISK